MSTFTGTPNAPFKRRPQDRFRRKYGLPCDGCNKSCHWLDYYMVHDSVWQVEAALPVHNCMLCISCLEIRIGRPLRRRDFTSAPVNDIVLRYLGMRWGEYTKQDIVRVLNAPLQGDA